MRVQMATYVMIRAWPWSKPGPVEGSEHGRASESENFIQRRSGGGTVRLRKVAEGHYEVRA